MARNSRYLKTQFDRRADPVDEAADETKSADARSDLARMAYAKDDPERVKADKEAADLRADYAKKLAARRGKRYDKPTISKKDFDMINDMAKKSGTEVLR